ncbi:5347_t:CDS:2, partial [Scutellospora calospora]
MSNKSEEQNKPDKINEVKDKDFKINLVGEYDGKFNIQQEVTHQAFNIVQTAGDAIQPFIPFFTQVTEVVKALLLANETAKCNQKICLALIDRVEIAQQAVNSLQRQQLENEKLFRDQNYYYAWVRFITVLENIRKFAKEITQLSSLQKYLSAMTVKETFDKNIKDFEDNMGELKSDVKIVMKELTQLSTNISELTKQITKTEGGHTGTADTAKLILNKAYEAPNIDPADLEPYPLSGYEPRISNFELSHTEHEKSLEVKSILDIIRWLAPEKMCNDSKKRYNLNRRYDHKSVIQNHVMSQKRETMEIFIYPHPIPQILAKIIKKAWNHEPSQRPKVTEMLSELKDLYERYVPNGTSPKVCPKGENDDIPVPGFTLPSATSNQRSNSIHSKNNSENTFSLPED